MTDRAVPPAGRSVLRRLAPRAVLPPLWRELAPAPDTMTQPPAPVPETPGLGEPVLLVPGFLVGDASLGQLAAYLGRAGYVPHPAGITRNVGCSEATVQVVVARLERLAECYGAPVAIVGHSRGGLLARVAARRRPDLVAGVVTLGSPHRDQLAVHPLVWASAVALATLGVCGVPGVLRFSCSGGGCCARFWDDVSAPVDLALPYLSIYTRRDGIVDWRACLDPHGRQLEVAGTGHRGLPADAPTHYAVASALGAWATAATPARRACAARRSGGRDAGARPPAAIGVSAPWRGAPSPSHAPRVLEGA